MRLFKMIIQKVPAESMTVTTCPVSGEEIIARNSSWFPKGWKEYVDEMAALDLGLTMTAVADRMNKTFHFSWTNTHVRRTEQAGRKLTLVEGFALADVLGLDVFQLVGLQPIDG